MVETNHVKILHFSDLHYGDDHIFTESDNQTLENSILQDFNRFIETKYDNSEISYLIAVTGDLINKGKTTEFNKAKLFLNTIKKPINCPKEQIFIVPGNHDVELNNKTTPQDKLKAYSDFYRSFMSLPNYCCIESDINIRSIDDKKIIVAEINSCKDLKESGTGKNKRIVKGVIDPDMITKLGEKLEGEKIRLGKNIFDQYIKIALLHHHAILLPLFMEKEKNKNKTSIIDEITVGDKGLLDKLTEFGFHLILHGHKHHPIQYLHDPNSSWYPLNVDKPILIVSGGSCGLENTSQKDDFSSCNTYNIIDVERNGNVEIKITVKTIGLNIKHKKRPTVESDKKKWHWENVKYRCFLFQFDQENERDWGWKIITSTKDFKAVEDTNLILKQVLSSCLMDNSKYAIELLNDPVASKELVLLNKWDRLSNEYEKLKPMLDAKTKENIDEYILPALEEAVYGRDEDFAMQLIKDMLEK